MNGVRDLVSEFALSGAEELLLMGTAFSPSPDPPRLMKAIDAFGAGASSESWTGGSAVEAATIDL